jgi:hypothetical protein
MDITQTFPKEENTADTEATHSKKVVHEIQEPKEATKKAQGTIVLIEDMVA